MLDILKFRMKTMNIKHGVLDELSIATVLREVLKGLEYFHANGHIHRYAWRASVHLVYICLLLILSFLFQGISRLVIFFLAWMGRFKSQTLVLVPSLPMVET